MAGSEGYYFTDNFYSKNQFLHCEGLKLTDLVRQLEKDKGITTPLFVYSKKQILSNISAYKTALNHSKLSYHLGYAVKANNNPHLLKLYAEADCTAIAVSGNEVLLALKVGFPANRVILNGNGKCRQEIQIAVSSGCFVNVDSAFDVETVATVCDDLSTSSNVLLRINPDIDSEVHPFLATGLAASKFGIIEDQVEDVLRSIKQHNKLNLVGLHCHIGSTIYTTESYRSCLQSMLALAKTAKDMGFDLKYINIGGGLGIDYHKHSWRTCPDPLPETKVPPSPGALIESIQDLLQATKFTIIVEPGRSLVANCGVLLCRVLGFKETKKTRFLVVDGSMTEVIRPCLYQAYHHIELAEPPLCETSQLRPLNVVGPVCESADFLGKDRCISPDSKGCLLCVFDVGAYCSSMSSNYNMRTRCAEVLVDGDSWRVIREQECFADLLRNVPDFN